MTLMLRLRRLPRLQRALRALDRLPGTIVAAGMLLVLPVSLLLFLQWPLREWVQAYSREANDLAQCLFALYVSIAIICASRQRTHLAADAVARRFPAAVRQRITRFASLFVLVPWSLWLLYTASPTVWRSVMQLESFPETFSPGYFLIKLALWLLGLFVFLQAVLDVLLVDDRDHP